MLAERCPPGISGRPSLSGDTLTAMYRGMAMAVVWAALLLSVSSTWAQAANDATALSQQGQEALEVGHYAEAAQAYEKLKLLQPSVAEIHATLGVIYFKEGKFDQAAKELHSAQRLKPGLLRVDALLAMTLSEQGHFQQALPGLEKGFHQSGDPDLKRMCGLRLERAYNLLNNDTKAVETALELQRIYPDDPEVLYYSSKIFGNEAFLAVQKLFQTAPNSLWGAMAAGEAHESQGDIDQAIADYRQVLKFDPAKSNIHFRIGRALLARAAGKNDPKDTEAAITEFQQELLLNSSNANAAYEMAEIYRKQGDLEQAQKYFQQAVDSYPSFEEAHVGLAATLIHSDPAMAQKHLQQAIAIDPQDPVAWYRLAQVERAHGHPEEQKHALAEFTRMKTPGTSARPALNPEVTPQQLDSPDPQ